MKKVIISLVLVAGLVATAMMAGCSIKSDVHEVRFGGHLAGQTMTKEENLKNLNDESGSLSSFIAFKQV